MSDQSGPSKTLEEQTELPIERGFPIEQINDIAEKEGYGGARQWYRPIYTMHKWWARRLGSVFRSICLYTLIDEQTKVDVFEPGQNQQLSDFQLDSERVSNLVQQISAENPDPLWEIFPKDVRIKDKKILDPFMGGGTSLVEASRFGVETHGMDINPVAWFVTKKELDTGATNIDKLKKEYERIEKSLAKELKGYYKTSCPNHPESHEADVMNSFWVKQVDCVSCSETVSLFSDYRVAKGRYENDDKYNAFCPKCESVILVEDWKNECSCEKCGNTFTPKEGSVSGSKYNCHNCGQKYPITDAIQEQNGFELKYYALEYHCPSCDEREDYSRADSKGYKDVSQKDIEIFEKAKQRWENNEELNKYVPDEKIPEGHMTSIRNPLFDHGYKYWKDMFNERQLLCMSLLLREIDNIDDQNSKEYLLLAATDMLNYKSMMISYKLSSNQVANIFNSNNFAPPMRPTEGNIWGAKYGTGTFQSIWEKLLRGIEWGQSPTERYIEYPNKNGYPDIPRNSSIESTQTIETDQFNQVVGENSSIKQGDARKITDKNEYDAVITDPPYYDNIIYSEVSDYFYVWQKIILGDTYECFQNNKTPRAESIVTNPFLDKTADDFEHELGQAFEVIHRALKHDGVLTFTYHHSDSESWGELLESLCNAGFEISATYPITADISKFIEGEAVSFDIVVVARPVDETEAASWNSLRRNIYRTARQTRSQLEANRDLSRGDIGVMEMGACFREYSKHHGKVQRDGEIMTAKEVVQEIYGIIQEASDIGVEDVFIDLLDTTNVSYDDVNKLCRGTNATPEDLKAACLYNQDDGFELGTWDNEKRQAYIQERANGDSDDHLSNLDKLQFLRYRYEKGQAVQNYVDKWGVDDDLRELAGRLADVTGDDAYTRVLGDRDITSY